MKMSKNKLNQLLRESVLSEQMSVPTSGEMGGSGSKPAPKKKSGAKDWDQYLKATSDGAKVKSMWDLVQDNKERIKSNSKSSPEKFDDSYRGWVKWYNTCRKDQEIMKALGKKAGSHITADEMTVVYASFLPPNDDAKDEVDEVFASIFDTGVPEAAKIQALRLVGEKDVQAILDMTGGVITPKELSDKIKQDTLEKLQALSDKFKKSRESFDKEQAEKQQQRVKDFDASLNRPKTKNESHQRRSKKLTRGDIRMIIEATLYKRGH